MTAVAAGEWHTLGLTTARGGDRHGDHGQSDVSGWTNIKAIAAASITASASPPEGRRWPRLQQHGS